MKTLLIILMVLCLLALLGTLAMGIVGMFRGQSGQRSNKLMQYRVLFQAIAIVLFALFMMMYPELTAVVQLTRIYTRGGDTGETSLGDGARVPKDSARIEAMGAVDEANAAIGLCRLASTDAPEFDRMLMRIQNDLFDLGADLCVPEDVARSAGALRIQAAQVERLEQEIDAINARLAPLNSFVLPGGSALSAYLHNARTITRRAERLTVSLAAAEALNPEAVKYLNRLSDHLFVLGRHANDDGAGDVLWVPGQNR